MDDRAADPVEDGFLHERRRRTLQAGFGRRVRDLPLIARGRHGADQDAHTLDLFARYPALQALPIARLSNSGDHLEHPVDGRDQVDVDHQPEDLFRVDLRLAGGPVNAYRQVIAGDAGCRDADADQTVMSADCVEHASPECRLRHVPLERRGQRPHDSRSVAQSGAAK